MGKRRLGLLLALLDAILLLPSRSLWAAGGSKYFPETGHTIQGVFLDYFLAQPDAPRLMGYPITEAITRNGVTIQYFQRVVLQKGAHDFAPSPLKLGSLFYHNKPDNLHRSPLPLNKWNTTGCQSFRGEDGKQHPVCYEFLKFYEKYKAYIGRVVSDPLEENGIPVQYFEGARLEYNPTHGRVTLSNLGEWYFQRYEPDPSLRLPLPPASNAPHRRAALQIEVRLAAEKILLFPGETQHIFIQVTNHLGEPLPGAQVSLRFLTPAGAPLSPTDPTRPQTLTTNAQGCAQAAITVPINYRGRVVVRVSATFADQTGESETTFRVWH